MKQVARIMYTTESRRGATRKSVEIAATPERLPAAVERKVAKLSDRGAFNVVVLYEVLS